MIDASVLDRPVEIPTRPIDACAALLATPDDFARWLLDHEPHAAVGQRSSAHSCPLAVYLRAALLAVPDSRTHYFPMVGIRQMRICGESLTLPDWAQGFVIHVDVSSTDSLMVNREMALRCLENATHAARSCRPDSNT